MPYQPIALGDHVAGIAEGFVRSMMDQYFAEFHFLLTVQDPKQGPKGSLQLMLATILLAATDGAAQMLHPGKMENGTRFKGFLKSSFPWHLDKPDGLSVDEACDFLWDDVRCPLLHRYAMRTSPLLQLKFGRLFSADDDGITNIEQSLTERPYSVTSVGRDAQRSVLWIEPFYWSLRLAVGQSLSTKEKADAVSEWIASGAWDPTRKRVKSTGN